MKSVFIACALVAGLTLPGAASASALPAATYNGYLTQGGTSTIFASAGTYSRGLSTLSMGGLPSDFASVTASGSGLKDGFGVGASGTPTYYAMLNGPGVSFVPLDLVINLSAFAHGASSAFAGIRVFVNGGVRASRYVLAVADGGTDQRDNFFGMLRFSARPGDLLRFDLRAEADAASAPGFASASTDPFLLIDPSFGDATAYSLSFSPGVGNAVRGGVPEPATWGMVLLGFGGLGSVVRRRRSRIRSAIPVTSRN